MWRSLGPLRFGISANALFTSVKLWALKVKLKSVELRPVMPHRGAARFVLRDREAA